MEHGKWRAANGGEFICTPSNVPSPLEWDIGRTRQKMAFAGQK
jgi:hypothetical protein